MRRKFITIFDAAAICSVSRQTIAAWLRKGHITRYLDDNGFNILIDERELLRYDRQRRARKVAQER